MLLYSRTNIVKTDREIAFKYCLKILFENIVYPVCSGEYFLLQDSISILFPFTRGNLERQHREDGDVYGI